MTKVAELEGEELAYYTAKAQGWEWLKDGWYYHHCDEWKLCIHGGDYRPDLNWRQAGELVEKYWYQIQSQLFRWFGNKWPESIDGEVSIWFCRAYVASVYGKEVDDVRDDR